MIVRLTDGEAYLAHQVGLARRLVSRARDYRAVCNHHNFDLLGAGGELAVAKALNVYWSAAVNLRAQAHGEGDVGPYQVRTASKPHYRLALYKSDPGEAVFILVVLRAPREFEIKGWILGAEAKRECFWDKSIPRPCYMVPHCELNAIEDLINASPEEARALP
jgi:hypothetical protein